MQPRDQTGLYKLNWNLLINASSWQRGAIRLRLRAVNPTDEVEMGATETSPDPKRIRAVFLSEGVRSHLPRTGLGRNNPVALRCRMTKRYGGKHHCKFSLCLLLLPTACRYYSQHHNYNEYSAIHIVE